MTCETCNLQGECHSHQPYCSRQCIPVRVPCLCWLQPHEHRQGCQPVVLNRLNTPTTMHMFLAAPHLQVGPILPCSPFKSKHWQGCGYSATEIHFHFFGVLFYDKPNHHVLHLWNVLVWGIVWLKTCFLLSLSFPPFPTQLNQYIPGGRN